MVVSKKALSITAGILLQLINLALIAIAVALCLPRLVSGFVLSDVAIFSGFLLNLDAVLNTVGSTLALSSLLCDLLFLVLPVVVLEIIAINYIYVKHSYKHRLAVFGVVVSTIAIVAVMLMVALATYLIKAELIYYTALAPFALVILLLFMYVSVGNEAQALREYGVVGDELEEVTDESNGDNEEEIVIKEIASESQAETASETEEATEVEPIEETEVEPIDQVEEIETVEEVELIEEVQAETTEFETVETEVTNEVVMEEPVEQVEEYVEEITPIEVVEEVVEEQTLVAEPIVEPTVAPIVEPVVATEQPKQRKKITAEQQEKVKRVLEWNSKGVLTKAESEALIRKILAND